MQLSTLSRDASSMQPHGPIRFVPLDDARTTPSPSATDTMKSQFTAMEQAYGPTLGMASAQEVVQRMQQHHDQPISVLAHWIVERKLLAFSWHAQTLLPLFQFQLSDMSLCIPTVQVVGELADTLDDWEMALWFALPNRWLRMATPVDSIEHDQPLVLDAARTERFIARW